MLLKIKMLVLYPVDKSLKPRVIRFEEDKINVITGYSQRGKSAIINIIDYCLGSSDCNIPIGKIRESVETFAIEILVQGKLLFIARENPDFYKHTAMYYEQYENSEERTFSENEWIENADKFRSNREDIKTYLGELAGFENISEKGDEALSPFDAPASFRDTTAFQFQSQNIIANPTTIFYNTDTFEHLKRLKTLFPLVLGYKSYEMLTLEKQISTLEKKAREKEKKLTDIENQYENWQTDIYSEYSRAVQLGLTQAEINIRTANVDLIKRELNTIVQRVKSRNFLQLGSSLRYSDNVQVLDSQRLELLRRLDELKVNLAKIEKFDKTKDEYIDSVAREIDNRLNPIDWFLDKKGTNTCPFCDSVSDKALNELLSLKNFQLRNRSVLQTSETRSFSFANEKLKLKENIEDVEAKIKNIESNIDILVNENVAYNTQFQDIFEFAGKIEHVIENLNKISPSGELPLELDSIRTEIQRKRNRLRTLAEKFDKGAALNKVTTTIDNYIKQLPIENREFRHVRLDPDNSVSIKIEDVKTGSSTFLSKLGSGANHMGYHLATLLGLHEYFLNLPGSGKTNYIPSFLVLDQFSQVYFPDVFPDQKAVQPTGENGHEKKQSEDIENTKTIFRVCSSFMSRTKFQTQIIILEHAPITTWEEIDNIHLVEEWRGLKDINDPNFNALIQKDWLSNW